MLAGFNLPYQPIRQPLYMREELFQGFEPGEPASWEQTSNCAIHRHFVIEGRSAPTNPYSDARRADLPGSERQLSRCSRNIYRIP